ncbi:unnamed protein product, partial [Musa acuminata subsp. burmannicoides]
MTKEWLVEVGLSPVLRGTARANPLLLGMPRASTTPQSDPPATQPIGDLSRSGGSEPDRPRKRPKTATPKMSVSVMAREATSHARSSPWGSPGILCRRRPLGARRTRSEPGRARVTLVCDLCCTQACFKDEPFQALSMGGLPEGEASKPLVAR